MVLKIGVFDVDWNKIEDKSLSESVFNEENINHSLIHEMLVLQEANSRKTFAHTKTRWEIVTSGRKLYRQKWTGRARVWDAWSPIRKGWGVAFWPRKEVNYAKSMPKKMRRKALYSILSLKAKNNEILWLDKFPFEEIKTKNAVKTLSNLWLEKDKVLFVLPELSDVYVKSFRNILNVKCLLVDYLNPKDILSNKYLLFTVDSLDRLQKEKK